MNTPLKITDGKIYQQELFNDNLDFLLEKELISKINDGYKVNFVGKIINHLTNQILISYPKNIDTDIDIDFIFNNFSNLKKDNNILLSNYYFDKTGNKIFSEYSFYKNFLNVFNDYLTNDFLVPKKQIISDKGTNIDVIKTIFSLSKQNRITYKKDDRSDFYLRNVFYTILKKLEKKYACSKEKELIKYLEEFYKSKGYIFKEIDNIPEIIPFVEVNNKSLLAYKLVNDFLSKQKKSKKFEINVFYTDKFEYVFEFMLKKALKHNKNYKKIHSWSEPDYKKSDIDIFNSHFMGDCKYYNIIEKMESYSFTKELYEYNLCIDNKITNYVFILSNETKLNKVISHDIFKLNIFEISIIDLINDLKNKSHNLFEKILTN